MNNVVVNMNKDTILNDINSSLIFVGPPRWTNRAIQREAGDTTKETKTLDRPSYSTYYQPIH